MELSRITTKGQVTLPAAIRRHAGLVSGDTVSFVMTDDGILVKPVVVSDRTKTPEWRRQLRQAQADARAGRGTFYASDKDLLKALK